MELRDVTPFPWTSDRFPRRTPAGWLLLAVLAVLVGFYLVVLKALLTPAYDEDFRRTYLTAEFGAYPPSPFFKGVNGLAYDPGTREDLTRPVPRHHLGRFDWIWRGPPGVRMVGFRGRIFVHIPPTERHPDRPYRVRLGVACQMADGLKGLFTVSANDVVITTFDCTGRSGSFEVEAIAPAGLIAARDYDKITVERTPEGWADRLWTRLDDRLPMFALAWFEIAPAE